MRTASADAFIESLTALLRVVQVAKKNRYSLATHRSYASAARTALAQLRKHFLMMQRDYPPERFPRAAFQLTTIEPLVAKLVASFPGDSSEMLRLLNEIRFKADSDLAAELDAEESTPQLSTAVPFLPGELIDTRHGVLQKILWEANRCYDAACYNACATMIRRLVESLIIASFERYGIADKIKSGDDYVEFGALIGKAAAESLLGLTRNTKRVLPDLKFFGDLAAHNRRALVRKDDLDRLHNPTRAAIEELARNV